MFRLRAASIERFDLSVEGFWKSFFAAVLTLPAYILMLWIDSARSEASARDGGDLVGAFIFYLMGWIIFPLISLVLTRFFDLGGRYVPLVVAHNWVSVWLTAIFVAALVASLVVPPPIDRSLLLMALVGALYVQWFVIKAALLTTGLVALGFVTLNVIVEQTVSRLVLG